MPRPTDKPTTAQRTALRARLRALGYATADAARLVRDGADRREIAAAVIAEQRQARKGT